MTRMSHSRLAVRYSRFVACHRVRVASVLRHSDSSRWFVHSASRLQHLAKIVAALPVAILLRSVVGSKILERTLHRPRRIETGHLVKKTLTAVLKSRSCASAVPLMSTTEESCDREVLVAV